MFKKNKYMAPSGPAGLVLAVALAFIAIRYFFTKDFILGTAPYWQSSSDDITQYFVGFNRYMDAPWRFPLLYFNSINYPEGTTATFVDAIPLYALLLKILVPKSFLPFNPYGAWVAICFVLQGVGAWWIAKELRVNSWIFLLSLAMLMLLSPTLIGRMGHISLMSHWVLLFGLALYIRGYRESKLPVSLWTLLLVPTFYINIYLLAMISGLYLASLLTIGIRQNPRVVVHFLIPYVLIFLSLFITLLPLPPTEITQELGFGIYSMNLLAPFMGGHIFQLQALVAPGQSEGFNYLGLGVMVLLVMALWYCYCYDRHLFKRHGYLLFLLFIYTVYALSNKIYFGETLLAILKYPSKLDWLTAQFRASGRFFWLVGYCIVIYSLFVLHRHLKPLAFMLVVVSLSSIQLFDLKNYYKTLHTNLSREPIVYINYEQWDQRFDDEIQHLYFYPKFKCSKSIPLYSLLPTMKYAALRNYTLNTGYVARYTPRCDDISEEIAGSSPSDSAYIFVKEDFETLERVASYFPPDSSLQCNELDFAFICQRSN